MKFKVGDKARVRKDIEAGKSYGDVYFAEQMEKYKGEIIVIEKKLNYNVGVYQYKGWNWADEMLEPVEEEKKMRNIDIIENDEKFKGHGACIACYMLKTGSDGCNLFECGKCEFKSIKVCYDFLGQEYKGSKIKLTKFEYDLLRTNDQPHSRKFCTFSTYRNMQEIGYFKDVNIDLSIKDILANCEVEE